MNQLSTVWKAVITVAAFLVAIWIASLVLQLLFGRSHPAWTIIVAFVLVSPVLVSLWRERFR